MNSLDWLLSLLLAYSVVRAVLRGFLREAFALGGLIAAFFWPAGTMKVSAYDFTIGFILPPLPIPSPGSPPSCSSFWL